MQKVKKASKHEGKGLLGLREIRNLFPQIVGLIGGNFLEADNLLPIPQVDTIREIGIDRVFLLADGQVFSIFL